MPPSGPASLTNALRSKRARRVSGVALECARLECALVAAEGALEVDDVDGLAQQVAHGLRMHRDELTPAPVKRFGRGYLVHSGLQLLGDRLNVPLLVELLLVGKQVLKLSP